MAKFLGSTGVQYLWTKIQNNFVAKEAGKGLSTNDFDNDAKAKLEGIATGAQVNVIEGIKVNGSAVAPVEKIVDISVITESDVSTLISDAIKGKADKATTLEGYGITDAYTKTETDTAIGAAVANAKHASLAIAETDPMSEGFSGKDDVIYLWKVTEKGNTYYDMYIKIGGKMTLIDDTRMDLTDYVTSEALTAALSNYYNKTDADGRFVQIEEGKGLSTNDFDNVAKTKLAGIAENAEVNVINTIKVNGTVLTPSDRAVDITFDIDTELSNTEIDAAIAEAEANA